MKQLIVRPIEEEDKAQLELWRRAYQPADLELPHGWEGRGTETSVVERPNGNGNSLSLTGSKVLALDPLIMNPDADPLELSRALSAAEYSLAYKGAAGGCVDAFIAVPIELQDYIVLLKRHGYEETAQNCVILRRSLLREREELIADVEQQLAAT